MFEEIVAMLSFGLFGRWKFSLFLFGLFWVWLFSGWWFQPT